MISFYHKIYDSNQFTQTKLMFITKLSIAHAISPPFRRRV